MSDKNTINTKSKEPLLYPCGLSLIDFVLKNKSKILVHIIASNTFDIARKIDIDQTYNFIFFLVANIMF